MGLVPLKAYLIAILIIVGLLFVTGSIGAFGLHWISRPKQCTEHYSYTYGEWKSLARVSHIELRYKPVDRVCKAFEYDPKEGWKPLTEVTP